MSRYSWSSDIVNSINVLKYINNKVQYRNNNIDVIIINST